MRIQVEAAAGTPRIWQNQKTWGIKLADGTWINLHREQQPVRGEVLDVNIQEKHGKDGKLYRDAFPAMPPLADIIKSVDGPLLHATTGTAQPPTLPIPQVTGNGKIPWTDYARMARTAHFLAKQLEPDGSEIEPNEQGEAATLIVKVDRSSARAAILNTCMIAFANGKVDLAPEPEDDIPTFSDDGREEPWGKA